MDYVSPARTAPEFEELARALASARGACQTARECAGASLGVADAGARPAGEGCALLPIGTCGRSLETEPMTNRRTRGEVATHAERPRRAARTEGPDARRE